MISKALLILSQTLQFARYFTGLHNPGLYVNVGTRN